MSQSVYRLTAASADVQSIISASRGRRLQGLAAAETAGSTASFRLLRGQAGNLVTNGTMAADTNWTKGTGWAIAGSVATKTGVTATALSQALTGLVAGWSYTVSFVMTRSAGSLAVSLGGTAGTTRSTANTFSEVIVAGSDGTISFLGSADFGGTVDTVTVTPTADSLIVPVALAASANANLWFLPEGLDISQYDTSLDWISGAFDLVVYYKDAN